MLAIANGIGMSARSSVHSRPLEPGSWPRHVLIFWLAALVVLTGCQRTPVTDLLQVSAVLPAEAQFGDSVQILGDGFALGSPATVSLRGSVYRAGQAPVQVDVSLRAQTDSQRELTVELPRSAEQLFCGPPERASHATFRGDVEVAISAKAPGAPPVMGHLHGAVLELYPAVKTQVAADRMALLGRRALEFFGMEVAEAPAGGLSVLSVAPGSRAVAADLRPGDRLVRAGGLSVLTPSDLVPEAARVLELGVMRGPLEQAFRLDVDGFSPTPPRNLGWPALMVGAVALGFVALASPLTRLLGWLVQNASEWRRQRVRYDVKGRGARVNEGFRITDLLGGSFGILVWLGVAAALLAPVLRRSAVDVSFGLLALMFGSAALLAVWQLISRGRSGARWSLFCGTRAALRQWLITSPALVAVLAVCFETGVDFDEMVRTQGTLPWEWNAFANPGLLVSFVLLLLTALPRLGRPIWRLSEARPPRLPTHGRTRDDSLLGWLYLCSMCAVATVAFLGGDAWPGQTADPSGSGFVPSLASASVLLAKYTGLVLSVSLLRTLSFGVTAEQWAPISLRVCLPLAIAAGALAHGFRSVAQLPPVWHWLELGFGPVSFGLLLLTVAVVARRVSLSLRHSPPPSLSTWL